ncbi:uncharacterized protein LOC133845438 [Drosophila sulfurigaster albostrigata]|uniref:uncharacterized protein LOC133845438 n=1 Tax=Drosophila sulfurigaster albostrigata TaxID=89887 RepID=UPI002D219079|nr:uncharacterized protein LOC133845438 [Drosophila sulfurigaster albostrigata]
MVGLWLLLLTALLAKSLAVDFDYKLPRAVLERLNSSSAQFDAWTRELSASLSAEHQRRVAWNVPFIGTPRSQLELRRLQQKLNPSNPLKLRLWISYYWQLRRSQLLNSDNMLLTHFVLTLRQLLLGDSTQLENSQLQNMLQSLPPFLATLVRSRWLCLKHIGQQLFLQPGDALQLGVSSNCSMWQVQQHAEHWLRLQNACEQHSMWFINMLHTHLQSRTYMLLTSASDNASRFCVGQQGVGYLEHADGWQKDCQWRLNDCTQLPQFLNIVDNGFA